MSPSEDRGAVHLIDLVGIEYGPIVVTATDRGDGPQVRYPVCLEEWPVEDDWRGEVVDCPHPGCEGHMCINPFVTRLKASKRKQPRMFRRR